MSFSISRATSGTSQWLVRREKPRALARGYETIDAEAQPALCERDFLDLAKSGTNLGDIPFPPFSDMYVYQIFSDLVMSLGIVLTLILILLRRKGRSLTGFYILMVGSVALGSFAPIIYLLIEKDFFDLLPVESMSLKQPLLCSLALLKEKSPTQFGV
jgi:hypothetical protein